MGGQEEAECVTVHCHKRVSFLIACPLPSVYETRLRLQSDRLSGNLVFRLRGEHRAGGRFLVMHIDLLYLSA